MTRKALGKGLNALLREPAPSEVPTAVLAVPQSSGAGLQEIPVDLVQTSPFQPRAQFDPVALDELAQSMRAGGVVQPIIVRPGGGGFELVAGERRLRAARLAGLGTIPALVRVLSDEQAVELSLVENIQREDLNALEQARAFERLSAEFSLTQEEIARRTGKDRATVANMMRLLRLPPEVQSLLSEGKISAGHARALLKLEESPVVQRVLARRMATRRLSVRQAEEMVGRRLPGTKRQSSSRAQQDPNVRAAEQAMERALGTKVRVVERRGGRGKVEIDYYSLEDLERIYDTIVHNATKPSS